MNRAPLLVGQWDDGGALQAWQHIDNLLQTGLGGVHTYIFLILGILYGLETEQHLLEDGFLIVAHLLVANQQSLTLHYNLNFAQIIAHQGRA